MPLVPDPAAFHIYRPFYIDYRLSIRVCMCVCLSLYQHLGSHRKDSFSGDRRKWLVCVTQVARSSYRVEKRQGSANIYQEKMRRRASYFLLLRDGMTVNTVGRRGRWVGIEFRSVAFQFFCGLLPCFHIMLTYRKWFGSQSANDNKQI